MNRFAVVIAVGLLALAGCTGGDAVSGTSVRRVAHGGRRAPRRVTGTVDAISAISAS